MFQKNNVMTSYSEFIGQINKVDLGNVSDDEILKISQDLINDTMNLQTSDTLSIKAFALVKEAIWRILGLRVYDEQLIAGIEMYNGKLIEMQTGEGKTLTAVFTAYLNSITGSKVSIFTFNDYLAKRDANLMGPVYRFLGLTVSYINESMNKSERKEAYNCDIVYLTAKEAGFDYLRDFLCCDKNDLIDLRSWQCRYSFIVEEQKMIIYNKRMKILKNGLKTSLINEKCPEVYSRLTNFIDKKTFDNLELEVSLYHINMCWADYLAYILDIRDMCYMEVLGGKNPLDKFEMDAVSAFIDFKNRVELAIIDEFKNLTEDLKAIKTLKEKVILPTSTWTYLLKENSLDEGLGIKLFSKSNAGISSIAMIFCWPIIFITFLFEHCKKRDK